MTGRTYRYFTGEVLYPFGFGLSYTTWKITNPVAGNGIVTVDVTNTGKMDGDAVIQVYVECESPDAPPCPRLCGFARAGVPAGETRTVSVPLDKLTDTVVNDAGERICVEHKTFHIGMSQPDEVSVRLTGVQPLSVRV